MTERRRLPSTCRRRGRAGTRGHNRSPIWYRGGRSQGCGGHAQGLRRRRRVGSLHWCFGRETGNGRLRIPSWGHDRPRGCCYDVQSIVPNALDGFRRVLLSLSYGLNGKRVMEGSWRRTGRDRRLREAMGVPLWLFDSKFSQVGKKRYKGVPCRVGRERTEACSSELQSSLTKSVCPFHHVCHVWYRRLS